MVFLIFAIFFISCFMAFFERHLSAKSASAIYVFIGFVLILMAGLREVGFDPDSYNYEEYYQNYDKIETLLNVEYSFVLLSSILSNITPDVHAIFLFYAIFGVALKFVAFKKYTDCLFLAVVVYMSYFYMIHEMTQIRTGILSACLLLAIKPLCEKRRIKAFVLLAVGTFFHISGLALIPVMFLKNKLSTNGKMFLIAFVLSSFLVFYMGGTLLYDLNIPYIGAKIASYQAAEETGNSIVGINVFDTIYLVNIAVFLYLLYFSETIIKHNKYFPIMMKIFAIGLFLWTALAFLPVLAKRLSLLYRIVSVILFSNIYYTIKPRYASIATVLTFCTVYLIYTLKYLDLI